MINRVMNYFYSLPAHERKITVPTMLTLLRLVLAPCVVGMMIMHKWGIACLLFLGAAFTDVLDGMLARAYNEKTFLGAYLDPIADKVLVLSVFFTLAFVQSPLFSVPLWFVVVILIKELILIGGSLMMYLRYGTLEIKPTLL